MGNGGYSSDVGFVHIRDERAVLLAFGIACIVAGVGSLTCGLLVKRKA